MMIFGSVLFPVPNKGFRHRRKLLPANRFSFRLPTSSPGSVFREPRCPLEALRSLLFFSRLSFHYRFFFFGAYPLFMRNFPSHFEKANPHNDVFFFFFCVDPLLLIPPRRTVGCFSQPFIGCLGAGSSPFFSFSGGRFWLTSCPSVPPMGGCGFFLSFFPQPIFFPAMERWDESCPRLGRPFSSRNILGARGPSTGPFLFSFFPDNGLPLTGQGLISFSADKWGSLFSFQSEPQS